MMFSRGKRMVELAKRKIELDQDDKEKIIPAMNG